MFTRDKIAGALYGVALGDALGRLTEFMDLPSIYRHFGTHGHMEMPHPALVTDDTQMTLYVSKAICQTPSLTPRRMAAALRKQFIYWMQHDPARAPGITCMTAIAKMKREPWTHWTDATVASSKGCGANMRVAPAAFIRDEETALGVASLQAAMTHGHPTALAASELTALAIRLAAQGTRPMTIVDRLLDHAVERSWRNDAGYRSLWVGKLHRRWAHSSSVAGMIHGWNDCSDALLDLRNVLRLSVECRPRDICRVLGEGWVADEALVLGLYFAITYCEDPVLAISEAARTNGDSDSIASIAGAIIGAYVGKIGWPTSWCDSIERRDEIDVAIMVGKATSR